MRDFERYVEPKITDLLFSKAARKKVPLSGTFELSPLCNFSCRMCYVRKTAEEVRNQGRPMVSAEKMAGDRRSCRQGGDALPAADRWGTVPLSGFLEAI